MNKGAWDTGLIWSYAVNCKLRSSNFLPNVKKTHTIEVTAGSMAGNFEVKLNAIDSANNVYKAEANLTFNISVMDNGGGSDDPMPAAPVISSAVREGNNYVITFSQPMGSLDPAGGYDTFINNQDQNDNSNYSGVTRTITGLNIQQEQCFKLEARYTQLEPRVFPQSNEICVAAYTGGNNDGGGENDAGNDNGDMAGGNTTGGGTYSAGLKAFPEAEGYRKNATGGRGGVVLKVTNLNDSGPGSLRAAVEATGPRIVIFEVGGRINLQSELRITNPDITIAGQHSVGDGITLSKNGIIQPVLGIYTNNVIIRYLTVRHSVTWESSQGADSIRIYGANAHDIIIDHCSLSWAPDGNIDITEDAKNVTVSNTIIHQAMGSGKNSLVKYGVDKISFYRNLFSFSTQRNWGNASHPGDFIGERGNFEFINNIVFRYKFGTTFSHEYPVNLNWINNRYLMSSRQRRPLLTTNHTNVNNENRVQIYARGNTDHDKRTTVSEPVNWMEEWSLTGGTSGSNYYQDTPDGFVEGTGGIYYRAPASYQVMTPFPTPIVEGNAPIVAANDLWSNLKADIGASLPSRDSEDLRVIAAMDRYHADNFDAAGVIADFPKRNTSGANTFPTIQNGSPKVDTDNDGLPDTWEMETFGDLSNTHNEDSDGDGYTNIEEYLNQTNANSVQEVKAFPSAQGLAALTTTGGRGGQVIHVTNLNDSGPGSLRAALQTSGKRTIIFDVSGVINLQSDISTSHGDFTVAGQTAPLGGITLIGTSSIRVDASNHIWRYIRIRNGYDTTNVDGGWVNTGSGINARDNSNFIFDHMSSGLAKETAGLGGGHNDTPGQAPVLTTQNNLIVESDRGTLVGDSNDADASTVLVYRNGWINVGWRFPKGGGTINLDVVNTYVYNWQGRTIRMDGHDYKLNVIGNHYEAGNQTRLSHGAGIMFNTWTNNSMNPQIWDEDNLWSPYVYNNGSSIYNPVAGRNYPADISSAWHPFHTSTVAIKSSWFASSRLPFGGDITIENILPSSQVKDAILENSGANKYFDDNGVPQTYRDKLDEGAINIAKGLSNSYMINGVEYSVANGLRLPESTYQSIALGLMADTPSSERPGDFYVSNPHIPEAYLQIRGIDGDANIHNQVQPSGYTLLEEYLNQVDN